MEKIVNYLSYIACFKKISVSLKLTLGVVSANSL